MLKLGRYWPWKTVSSHFYMPVRPMLLHRIALVSFRLFCKNLGNLQEFFGQMVYRPPWPKIVRTPMSLRVERNWTLISFTVPLEKRFVVLTLKQPRRLTKRQRHWGRRKIRVDNYQQFSARAMKSWWNLKTLARAKFCTCSEFCKFLYYSLLG